MRKIIVVLLSYALIFSLSGCGRDASEKEFVRDELAGAFSSEIKEDADIEDEKGVSQTDAGQTETVVFNFDTKTVMLDSGYEMPLNGIGTYSLTGQICVDSVSEALECGVRLIDTAYMYHNEESVGKA